MKTEMPKRKFPGTAASMLTGIATITDSAKDHVEALEAEDTSVDLDYLKDLEDRITTATRRIIGTDKRKEVRSASNKVKDAVKSARHELGHFRDLILRKYASDAARRTELLTNLGFTEHYTEAVSGNDQDELGNLLLRLDTNLTQALESELTGKGLPPSRVSTLRGFAASFKDQQVDRKDAEGKKRELTAQDVATLNALYTEVMSIARLGQRTFKDQSAVCNRFVYDKIVPSNRPDDEEEENKHDEPTAPQV